MTGLTFDLTKQVGIVRFHVWIRGIRTYRAMLIAHLIPIDAGQIVHDELSAKFHVKHLANLLITGLLAPRVYLVDLIRYAFHCQHCVHGIALHPAEQFHPEKATGECILANVGGRGFFELHSKDTCRRF